MILTTPLHTPAVVLTHHCGQRNLKIKARFLLGSLLAPKQTRRWLGFIQANPVMQSLATSHPHLIDKIYRPYLYTRLSCAERVDALIGHYEFIFKTGLEKLVKNAAGSPVNMGKFSGKSGALYQLELSAINISHREGELCLRLASNGVNLYTITFIFLKTDGVSCVKIGCLQGMLADNGAEYIKQATRDLHGCRPKNLMISIVSDIANYFGCKDLLLTSNDNRISINQRRRQGITSNYDQTWEEIGAVKRPDGDYALDVGIGLQKKNIEDTPSHKRSEAKKRNALIDVIFVSVRTSLDQWKQTHEPARIFSFPVKMPAAEASIDTAVSNIPLSQSA
jgi:uncharacterized protein